MKKKFCLLIAVCGVLFAGCARMPVEDTTPSVGEVFSDCAHCPQMVVLPAGSFPMGSHPSAGGRYRDEGPVHRVTIARPFAVGVYEVTFAEWEACAHAGGCGGYIPDDEGWGRGNRPVIHVSWSDAHRYVQWLSRETRKDYRLLSEAEWEYAARAGATTRYHWGNSISPADANYDASGFGRTLEAGSYTGNGWGLHDVHGNVYEWVQDCWNRSYQGAPSDGSAWESGDCHKRVLRGGSWYNSWRNLRATLRVRLASGERGNGDGFRVAQTLTP